MSVPQINVTNGRLPSNNKRMIYTVDLLLSRSNKESKRRLPERYLGNLSANVEKLTLAVRESETTENSDESIHLIQKGGESNMNGDDSCSFDFSDSKFVEGEIGYVLVDAEDDFLSVAVVKDFQLDEADYEMVNLEE